MRINYGHPSNIGIRALYDMTKKNFTNIQDLSGGNHTATGTNILSTDWKLSDGDKGGNTFGYTLGFDGSTKFLEAPDINLRNSSGNSTGEISISLWVLPSSVDGTIIKQYEDDLVGNLNGTTQYYNTTNTGFFIGGDRCPYFTGNNSNSASLFVDGGLTGVGNLIPTGDLTISSWVNSNENLGDINPIVSIWGTAASGQSYHLYIDPTGNYTFTFRENDPTFNIVEINSLTSSSGVRTNLLATFNKSLHSGDLRIDNGVLISGIGSFPGSGLNTGIEDFGIGIEEDSTSLIFDGKIGPTAVWDRVLTTGESIQVYNSGIPLLFSDYTGNITVGMNSHWDLTEISGVSRADSTGGQPLAENRGTVHTTLGATNHNSFTCISTWKLTSNSDDMVIVGNYDGTSNNRQWKLNTDISDANDIEFRVNNFGSTGTLRSDDSFPLNETGINYSAGTINTGLWVFSVCGYNAGTDKLFLDINNSGVETGSWANGVSSQDTSNFMIGGANNVGTGVENRFDGPQTMVAFWNRVLTTGETNYIYNNGETLSYEQIGVSGTVGSGLLSGLISWYRLDSINDSHSGNLNLTNNGSITFDYEGNSGDDSLRKAYRIGLEGPSGITFGINNNMYSFSGVLSTNWQHLLLTFNGDVSGALSGQKLFIDGAEQTNGILISGDNQSSLNDIIYPVTIAKRQNINANYFGGRIRNIRIYNRAFNLSGVKQLYTLEKK